jgi:predicted DsbA family dithiol-disulfide isomerase
MEFEVRWLPFQLTPDLSKEPSSKIERYMQKFGRTQEEVKMMGASMGQRFREVGLPFNFTEKGLVSNTFDSHRVLTAAYKEGGSVAQDKAAEILFNAYFNEEKAPSDPEVLRAAAAAAGLDADKLVSDDSVAAAETKEELERGRRMGVTGVPFFVIKSDETVRPIQVSGAQPPDMLSRAFVSVAQKR